MTYRDDPWMALCADRACVACGIKDETIVACHSNQQAHGKGMSIKAESWVCVPLCGKHHFWLDHVATREEARAAWAQWWALHMMSLCQAELVAPINYSERVKPFRRLAKILPRDSGPRAA